MVTKNPIPAAGYARRSTDLQERSIPDQKIAVERWAEANGHRIVEWYVDDAISGTSAKGREQFERMIHAAETAKRFRAVLCYDMSRFSRGGTNETGFYLHRLRVAGVQTHFTAEGIPEGDEGELLQGVKSWQARQYSVKLSRDSIRGQHSTIVSRHSAMGGRAPYGFDRRYETASGQVLRTIKTLSDGRREELGPDGRHLRYFEPLEKLPKKAKSDIVKLIPGDPERVKVVREIFAMCAKGYGCRSIVISLNQRGIPGPMESRWNQQAVKTILLNPAYRGALAWNRRTFGKLHGVAADGTPIPKKVPSTKRNGQEQWVVVENVHEALVSPELFQKAHEAMAKRRGRGGQARPSQRYLLSGLVRCTHCGLNYWGCHHGAKGRKHRYYADAGYRAQGPSFCKAVHIQSAPLDAWVLEQVRDALLGHPDVLASAVEQFVQAVCVPPTDAAPSPPAVDRSKELTRINARIKRTVALMADPDLGDIDELKAELLELKRQRDELSAPLPEAPPVARPLADAAPSRPEPDALRRWAYQKIEALAAALSPDGGGGADLDLRTVVHEIVDRIEIDPHTKTGVMYMPADVVAALEQASIRRVRLGSSIHSWIVLDAARLGSPRCSRSGVS